MGDFYTWTAVAVIALVTAALRFLPFFVFDGKGKTPKIIEKLSASLPHAIMGMLVIYCLKGTSLSHLSDYLPALISRFLVVVLHVWKRNTLLSILCGTVCYMLLVQLVF